MANSSTFNCTDHLFYLISTHREDYITGGPLVCEWRGCRYAGSFGNPNSLIRHVRATHVSPRSFLCPFQGCGRPFNRKDNLDAHILRSHTAGQNTATEDETSPRFFRFVR